MHTTSCAQVVVSYPINKNLKKRLFLLLPQYLFSVALNISLYNYVQQGW
jgi:hypothetical protein